VRVRIIFSSLDSVKCSHFFLMAHEPEEDGQIYTLGLIERLRDDLRAFDRAKGELYSIV
jgi:hypothetical protein